MREGRGEEGSFFQGSGMEGEEEANCMARPCTSGGKTHKISFCFSPLLIAMLFIACTAPCICGKYLKYGDEHSSFLFFPHT